MKNAYGSKHEKQKCGGYTSKDHKREKEIDDRMSRQRYIEITHKGYEEGYEQGYRIRDMQRHEEEERRRDGYANMFSFLSGLAKRVRRLFGG